VCQATGEALMENIQVKNCVLYRVHCFANYITNKLLLIIEL